MVLTKTKRKPDTDYKRSRRKRATIREMKAKITVKPRLLRECLTKAELSDLIHRIASMGRRAAVRTWKLVTDPSAEWIVGKPYGADTDQMAGSFVPIVELNGLKEAEIQRGRLFQVEQWGKLRPNRKFVFSDKIKVIREIDDPKERSNLLSGLVWWENCFPPEQATHAIYDVTNGSWDDDNPKAQWRTDKGEDETEAICKPYEIVSPLSTDPLFLTTESL